VTIPTSGGRLSAQALSLARGDEGLRSARVLVAGGVAGASRP
jgi:hypothetical protein